MVKRAESKLRGPFSGRKTLARLARDDNSIYTKD
jgi:hypothetical protein